MEGRTTLQALKLRCACVASTMMVGSEFLEVGRMAESTKGVEENDKGTEGKRGDIGAKGETRNGGRKREEEEEKVEEKEEEDDDEKEEEEEKGGQGEEPSNLHPATAPDLGRTNH